MIRDARPEERGELEALQRRASDVWPAYRDALARHPEAIQVPEAAITEGRTRVALDANGDVCGFSLVLAPVAGEVEIDWLFVAPEEMGTGVGRALVEDLAARARDGGASALGVVTGPEAVGFYERVGFMRLGAAETRFAAAFRLRRPL